MKMMKIKLFFFVIWEILFLVACQEKTKKDNEPLIPEDVVPDKLTIEPESIDLKVGESCQLVVKLNGTPLEGNEVQWTSNSSLLDVDDNGRVTAVDYDEFISGLNVKATVKGGQLFAICRVSVHQLYNYKLRLILKDKGRSEYSLSEPERFLSSRAIERRHKQDIDIDDLDLPISKNYLAQIEEIGGTIIAQSKWLKTVCVQCPDEDLIDKYKELPFVEDVIKVWRGKDREQNQDNYEAYPLYIKNIQDYSFENYAEAWENIALHKGQLLHERGFRGEGIDIAVIDAGFINLPQNSVLNNIRIKGARSFIYEDTNPYNTDEHGIGVVACMATDRSGYYVGTAPDAAYWLLRSEDVISGDYPVEEDYWVAAMEYADSVGVDLVNTSLSYIEYEWPFTSYKYEDMDGRTAMPTRAANIAVDKGIFVVCCAGNGGSWVGTPADSPNVLTVGAVTASGNIGSFTAYGMTVDGRMKPDVMSLGSGVLTIDVNGNVVIKSGTSYASPILCGLVACLWQAYPELTNKQLLDILKRSSDRYVDPALPYGYGICDMEKAFHLAEEM